jgi:hypothetical protein
MKSGVKAFEEEKCCLYTASCFRTLIETAVVTKITLLHREVRKLPTGTGILKTGGETMVMNNFV